MARRERAVGKADPDGTDRLIGKTSIAPGGFGPLTRSAAASANFDDFYQIDPDLSIKELPISHSTLQPYSRAHSINDRSQPTTCHKHEPADESMSLTAWIARQTTLRTPSIRKPCSSAAWNLVCLPQIGRHLC